MADDEPIQPGLSRRSALKRIGAGAAIAWSAPVILSAGSRAFAAAGSPGPGTPCNCTLIPPRFCNTVTSCICVNHVVNGQPSGPCICVNLVDPTGRACQNDSDCTIAP